MNIDELTFGVEIECFTPRGQDHGSLAAHLAANGIAMTAEGYNHAVRPYWKIVSDGSLVGGSNGFGYGTEVVSPILRGQDGLRDAKTVLRLMTEFGCRINRTCGLHVHVGAREHARVGFFKELVRTYAKFEPVIDELVAPSRRRHENSYCKPVTFTPSIGNAKSVVGLRNEYGVDRYRKLNLEAFWRHGTVEFRQHQGTLNPEKVENWVKLCLRMVAHATKNTERDSEVEPPTWRRAQPQPIRRDLTQGIRIRPDQLEMANSYNFRNWGIAQVTRLTCPWRHGSEAARNWDRYTTGHSVRAYRQSGGGLYFLRRDVERGHVIVVDLYSAPVIVEEPAAVPEVTFERPATDVAPTTLDGLMDLIEAEPTERAYFAERQLELNS